MVLLVAAVGLAAHHLELRQLHVVVDDDGVGDL